MPEGVGDGFIRVNDPRSPAAVVRVNEARSLKGWGSINGVRSPAVRRVEWLERV